MDRTNLAPQYTSAFVVTEQRQVKENGKKRKRIVKTLQAPCVAAPINFEGIELSDILTPEAFAKLERSKIGLSALHEQPDQKGP